MNPMIIPAARSAFDQQRPSNDAFSMRSLICMTFYNSQEYEEFLHRLSDAQLFMLIHNYRQINHQNLHVQAYLQHDGISQQQAIAEIFRISCRLEPQSAALYSRLEIIGRN